MIDYIIILIFLFVSILLLWISKVVKRRIKRNCCLEIEAIVEDHSFHHDYGANSSRRTNIYGYDYAGKHYTVLARTRIGGVSPVGSRQMVIIDPDNPQDCYRRKDLIFPMALRGIGILMLCDSLFYTARILMDLFSVVS